jgi:FMN phosphatase YigB (HAD superfamily)|tara:strand:- start:294 stop:890 length:597 start_codon:yes stop_codon:yes gene_type:complete
MSKIIGIDVDGVLLKWEEAFDDFMTGQGLTKKDQGHFDLRKHYPDVPAEALNTYISVFNESAYMRYLEPMDGAVEYVTKLAEEGYKFSVVSSQTTNKVANRAREDNLKEVFGDVFEDFTFLETGQGKYYALQKFDMETIWIDDKPDNVESGKVLGLVPILLDLPHNRSYNNKQMNIQRANSWKDIYDIIKEKHNVTNT